MKTIIRQKVRNEKGMTLIELLAVIVILAIIALIAIPAISNIISNSKSKAILSDAAIIIKAAKTAVADGHCTLENSRNLICDEKVLNQYVGQTNHKLVEGDKVLRYYYPEEKKDIYSIQFSEFDNLNDKYSDLLKDASVSGGDDIDEATEEEIATAMQGKKVDPNKP
ncbi:prepilin-type N-terminal cleavage/methylation domain-containing protein [Kurthia zopfii]|uniref:prepilin-type N-terminal cleavage/methylation domain-containing protein n=1 Tax=Kurthia zopfii TaxID=1650 RepID=UPI000F6D1F14|nr:prepilin-type N-terminal cleavage/methylation domain-containing protein [Kurthia zopfii]VEI07916.1 putative major pilin subunit [Kurthia zopfii]